MQAVGIPAVQIARIGAYIMKQTLRGVKRYPLVLMLEPLFQCNLRCKGCGKVDQPASVLNQRLSVEECAAAAEECGAPIVSIPGGEPLLHPDLPEIVRRITAQKRFVYLCTNALLVPQRIHEFTPSPYLTFNVHLDGLAERHDELVCRPGTFAEATNAIRMLLNKGFRVTTNSTFFNDEAPERAAALFDHLTSLKVEGITVAPGFHYEGAKDQDNFLGLDRSRRLFRRIFELGKNKTWRFNHSILYLDFLAGNQDYACSPWGNPTRSIFGWQRPCYLLDDGFAPTFKDLMERTDWDRYGRGRDPRCAECMVHCGYEPTAVMDSARNPLKALRVTLRGVV